MDDFDYVVRDSNAAWLEGRGDGRFERYESFYRGMRTRHAGEFDLEKANEAYAAQGRQSSSRLLLLASSPQFAQFSIGLLAVFIASHAVPALARQLPYATGALLLAAFVGLRVFHRQRRGRR